MAPRHGFEGKASEAMARRWRGGERLGRLRGHDGFREAREQAGSREGEGIDQTIYGLRSGNSVTREKYEPLSLGPGRGAGVRVRALSTSRATAPHPSPHTNRPHPRYRPTAAADPTVRASPAPRLMRDARS